MVYQISNSKFKDLYNKYKKELHGGNIREWLDQLGRKSDCDE